MPEENSGDQIQGEPSSHPSMQPLTQPPNYGNPPAQPTGDIPNQNAATRLEQDIRMGEMWLIFIQIVTVLVNIGIGAIYYGQLKEMQKATVAATRASKTAADTLTEAQANDARQALLADQSRKDAKVVSDASAKDAADALQATIDNFHKDQRAWIGVENIVGTPIKGQPFDINVFIRNTGKTPALRVHAWKHVEPLGDLPEVRGGCRSTMDNGVNGEAMMNPNGQFVLNLHPSHGEPLTQGVPELVGAGKRLYVYGCVTYEDVSRTPHWMTYCSVMTDDGKSYFTCNKYNDTGDGPLPI